MPALGPKTIAAGGFVVSVATGYVTNLLTEQRSWALFAFLAVLVAVGIILAIQGAVAPAGRRTRARIRADRGGRIERSGVTGRQGGVIRQRATRRGRITDSPVIVREADADQTVKKDGEIVDSPVDLE
ncbi:hypothetical protein GR925_24405 [Streptomyces sp. HUCO-GS316]|uniref:hypothetical protein n=1 Tax=Streptomyces sp. HUCO-GS316 TaxID=2692198 RepID=UPI00136B889E|nr:hypothetical protein [Streptomyces sp. HUCO-GS316]MXM66484.1 hypothetical protein [Streptomyces sp. HUCO-GS316]